jgi:Homeodomain-like domain
MPDISDALYRAVSRRRRAPAVDVGSLVDRLTAAGVPKREIASRLGVSTRTVQRWTTTTGRERSRPRRANLDRLRSVYRRSPEVRRADISPRRAGRLRSAGARVHAVGVMGPRVAGREYRRYRDLTTDVLSPEALAPVLDAWERGDDAGAREALEAALDREYLGGFELADELDRLEFLP